MTKEKILSALTEWHEELNMPWDFYENLTECMELTFPSWRRQWERQNDSELIATHEEAFVANDFYFYVKSQVNFTEDKIDILDIHEVTIDEFLDLYNDKEYTKLI